MTLFALIDRNLDKTRLWENPVAVQHYVELAMRAAMSPKEVMVNKKRVLIQPGQVAVSVAQLAAKWRLTTGKVRGELKMMMDEGLIRLETVGNTCSIVTLTCCPSDVELGSQPPEPSDSKQICKQNSKRISKPQPPSAKGLTPSAQQTDLQMVLQTDLHTIQNNKNIENNILYNKKKINKEEVAKGKLGLYYTDGAPDYEEGLWN